jgi:type II secretory pathway component GspD/PulD (secretin)
MERAGSPERSRPKNSSKYQGGVILAVNASPGADATIDLSVAPQIVEFEKATPTETSAGAASAERNLIFSTRSITSDFTIVSGQTVVLSGFGKGEAGAAFPGKVLLLLITARNLTFDEAPR